MFFSLDLFVANFAFFKQKFALFLVCFLPLRQIFVNFVILIRFHFYALEFITSILRLVPLLLFFKNCYFFRFNFLVDIIARDYIQKFNLYRFGITYILRSLKWNIQLYFTLFVNEFDSLLSVTRVFANAN